MEESQGKRRKVRCTFSSSNRSSCVECELRGSTCVGQDLAGAHPQLQSNRRNVRDRIGRLEALVETLLHHADTDGPAVDDRQSSTPRALDPKAVGPLTPSSESSLEIAGQFEKVPLFSPVENATVSKASPPRSNVY